MLTRLIRRLFSGEDPEVKAGWGPLNLNFLFKSWAWHAIEWHDRVTSKGSEAQKRCIPGDRVAEAWAAQLQNEAAKTESRVDDVIADVAGPAMKEIQPFFYEGPATTEEAVECLIRQGRNPDGTKI